MEGYCREGQDSYQSCSAIEEEKVNLAHNVRIKSTLKPINQMMKMKMPKEGRVLIATSCLLSGYDRVSYTHKTVER